MSMSAVPRRRFLGGAGTIGLLLASGNLLPPAALADQFEPTDLTPLGEALEAFSLDTCRGLAVMVMPGPDAYSLAQGTPRTEPGAMEIRLGEFVKGVLDNYLAAGDQFVRPLALNIAEALQANGFDVAPFLGISEAEARNLDRSLGYAINDGVLPLSVPASALLNLLALQVAPNTLIGPLGSPFSRLNLADKCRVFELIEDAGPKLFGQIDDVLPDPIKGSAAGFLEFVGGALLELSAFGAYSETDLYDRKTKVLSSRPIPWDLTGYRPDGLVDGQNDFIGYYQGRTEISADA